MDVCKAISGETVALLDPDDFQGQTAMALKQRLSSQMGVSRFRLILLTEDGVAIRHDEVFAATPIKLQLLFLDFLPADVEEDQRMMVASRKNDLLTLEALLKGPRNPDIADHGGRTPLHHAALGGHVAAAQLLLEAGAEKDPTTSTGKTPLWMAAQGGLLEVVRFLVEVGADKDHADTGGTTPFWTAGEFGHLDVCGFLREAGCSQDPI
ncbi:ANKRD50 [Symbiodinium natans]|uniref:ANKRD50 protein n=1 Tax=Symbiodinium natans TaxID=878477 RepID=A0A812PU45_9DINO|nr:ANKRD50 [Symbiodinium natans]